MSAHSILRGYTCPTPLTPNLTTVSLSVPLTALRKGAHMCEAPSVLAAGGGDCSVCIHLRFERGELTATVGIDGNAKVGTKTQELGQIKRNPDGSSTLAAGLIFALLGTSEPILVPTWQPVTVFHSGLDLFIVPGAVPALGYKQTL